MALKTEARSHEVLEEKASPGTEFLRRAFLSGFPVRMLWVGLICGLASWFGAYLGQRPAQAAVIWPTNGILLGVLIACPRRHWAGYLASGSLACLLVHLAFHIPLNLSLIFMAGNTVEIAVSMALLWVGSDRRPDLTNGLTLLKFTFGAVLLSPVCSAATVALLRAGIASPPGFVALSNWYIGDALGIAIMTPLVLSIRPFELMQRVRLEKLAEAVGLLTAIAVLSVVVFRQTSYPITFLLFPALLLVAFRLGISGSAAGVLLLAIPAAWFTVEARGPLAVETKGGLLGSILVLQFFFCILLAMGYTVAVALAERKRLEHDLQYTEETYRVLAENSWDIIVRADLNGRGKYVSPSVREVLGWEPEEYFGDRLLDKVHEEDRPILEELFEKLKRSEHTQAAVYRVKRKVGGYLWVEINARAVRDPQTGELHELIGVVRDANDRVVREREMAEAFSRAEALAGIDPVTSQANRRTFDTTLSQEWLRAIRERKSLSLLMIDIDQFKNYNDIYGHVAGDACLRSVAMALTAALHRRTDVATRYGGEEFAVILPNTDAAGAFVTAERLLAAIAGRKIEHSGTGPCIVTVSIGVATMFPSAGSDEKQLIHAADSALYVAKKNGRNQVSVWQRRDAEMGNPEPDEPEIRRQWFDQGEKGADP
jgi:diguanylate cyclase (GGDEF)-like protein/PAS domain S-box-containing protein